MTLIKAENRELTHSRYSSTKGIPAETTGSGTGVLLGTDFRHAVEFSKSGRARTPAFRPSSEATSHVRRTTVSPRRSVPPAPDGVSRGAERKLRPSGGRCQTRWRVTPDTHPAPSRHVPETPWPAGQAPGTAVRWTPATTRLPRRR